MLRRPATDFSLAKSDSSERRNECYFLLAFPSTAIVHFAPSGEVS
jgi:hypothetical protein